MRTNIGQIPINLLETFVFHKCQTGNRVHKFTWMFQVHRKFKLADKPKPEHVSAVMFGLHSLC